MEGKRENNGKAPEESPVRLVIITAIAIFVAEAFAMFIISLIEPMSHLEETLIDSSLLVMLISPALYFFLFRPLLGNIHRREEMEKEVLRLAGIPTDNPDPIIEINVLRNRIVYSNDAGIDVLPFSKNNKPGEGKNEIPVDWNLPIFSGLKPMVGELVMDGTGKSLDVMATEVGVKETETYKVFSRKLRYLPKESLVRLYTADITREEELIKTTQKLLQEVNEIRKNLEKEHREAEQIAKLILRQNPENDGLVSCVEVEPSSKAGGDRAGFIGEKSSDGIPKEWLLVLDASGHGKGAAKFQEVALGGFMSSLEVGHTMKEALTIANKTLEKMGTGRFLVGNMWRLMPERESLDGWIWVEEYNIAQHYILQLDPEADTVNEWQWPKGSGGTTPMGLFDDGFENIEPQYRKIRKGSRILTYTDGITEAINTNNEQFGTKRLKDLMLQTRELSPELARLEILRAAKCWTGGVPENAGEEEIGRILMEDDITIAIVDIEP